VTKRLYITDLQPLFQNFSKSLCIWQRSNKERFKCRIQRDLLKKSAALKAKTTVLKQQMEQTAKECQELLHPDAKQAGSDSSL
jgi:hypothetical protein